MEAWHRRIKSLIGASHPGVVALIVRLKEEAHYQAGQIRRCTESEDDRTSKKYSGRESKLRMIVDAKSSMTTEEFLATISRHVKGLIDV